MIGYTANTVLFILTGIIIIEKSILRDPSPITGMDYLFLFVLYIMINIIRFASIVIL